MQNPASSLSNLDRAAADGGTAAAASTLAQDDQPLPGGATGLPLAPNEGAGTQLLDWLAAPPTRDPRVRREIALLNEQAMAKVSARDFRPAVDLLRRVINFTPDSFAAHGNLAAALWQAGQPTEAEVHCRRAISLNRDHVPALMILGHLLLQRRNFIEALACYSRVALLDPAIAVAHNNAGLVLRKLGDFAQAESAFARAAALMPDDPRIRFNQLMMRRDNESLPEAIDCCRRSIALRGEDADILTNLGVGLQLSAQYDESLAAYEKAISLQPQHHDAHFNLSLLLLLRGDYERGWDEYEHRWHLTDITKPQFSQPMWNGERLHGKTILLRAEQGFGDSIQCLRYVPAVAEYGGRIIVCLERAVVRLAASLATNIIIKPANARLPAFDVWCPLLSLPRILNTRIESVPVPASYLSVRPGMRERWRLRFAELSNVKVGIAWAGNPKHINDLRRSISLDHLKSLLEVPDVSFVSLQVGPRAADLATLPPGTITDLSAELTDFAETAGAIMNLDLVIAVDTSVVHLAGALGKPVWLMLPFSPDWRWLLDRADSPWYPTARLYRQPTPGDWDSVIARVAADLAALVTARAGRDA